MIANYSQYKNDFFNKLNFNFKKGKKILDVGCGEGTDAKIFIKEYGLDFYGIDIYKDSNVEKQKLNFNLGSIYKIPFKKNSFDYIFVHDVLHHIDPVKQEKQRHLKGLEELRRVCKKGGEIIIVEGNRYNPLFYPHMVLLRKHEHFAQSYFMLLIKSVFKDDKISFRFFEAHLYPRKLLFLLKIYEYLMERVFPKQFIAYNAAVIKKQ